MADATAATSDTAPSPWWPCPVCGHIHFHTTVVFERGEWSDEDTYVHFDPPTGRPSAIQVDDVECVTCGFRFDIGWYYEWPVAGMHVDGDEEG